MFALAFKTLMVILCIIVVGTFLRYMYKAINFFVDVLYKKQK